MEKMTVEPQNLFYLKSGEPLPVIGKKDPLFLEYGFIRNPILSRGMSKVFSPKKVSNLLMQLRALIGVSSRSEVLLYLMINRKGTIQDVLYDMGHSSVVTFPKAKKGRIYYLEASPWLEILLQTKEKQIEWVCWPSLFRALEILWEKMNDTPFLESSTLEQAAEIQQLTEEELLPRIAKSGFNYFPGKLSGLSGEAYLKHWIEGIEQLVGKL